MISLFVLVLIGQAMAFDIVKLIEDSKYTAGRNAHGEKEVTTIALDLAKLLEAGRNDNGEKKITDFASFTSAAFDKQISIMESLTVGENDITNLPARCYHFSGKIGTDSISRHINKAKLPALECDFQAVPPILVDHDDTMSQHNFRSQCLLHSGSKAKVVSSAFNTSAFNIDGCYTKDPCSRYRTVKNIVDSKNRTTWHSVSTDRKGHDLVKRCSPTSDVIKVKSMKECLDKVQNNDSREYTIPGTLLRCVSTDCQARGINIDEEYVISYGLCDTIKNKISRKEKLVSKHWFVSLFVPYAVIRGETFLYRIVKYDAAAEDQSITSRTNQMPQVVHMMPQAAGYPTAQYGYINSRKKQSTRVRDTFEETWVWTS